MVEGSLEVTSRTLYWCPQTRASRAAWMLEELGLEYERVHIDIRDDERQDPEGFRRASPLGKVPALADGDAYVSDSATICLYLADRYSLGELAPKLDAPERADYLYWTIFNPGAVEPAMSEKFAGNEPNSLSNSWGDFDRVIAAMESGLEGREWIVGDHFTAADLMLGSSVLFLRTFGGLPESPVLEAYADRCAARPAYQKAMSFDAEAAG